MKLYKGKSSFSHLSTHKPQRRALVSSRRLATDAGNWLQAKWPRLLWGRYFIWLIRHRVLKFRFSFRILIQYCIDLALRRLFILFFTNFKLPAWPRIYLQGRMLSLSFPIFFWTSFLDHLDTILCIAHLDDFFCLSRLSRRVQGCKIAETWLDKLIDLLPSNQKGSTESYALSK